MTTETKKEKKDLRMKASTMTAQDRKRRNHKGSTVPNTRLAISASPGVSILLGTSENTLVNVPFNATAHADSRDSIIFDNTPRLYIRTKRYHKIH